MRSIVGKILERQANLLKAIRKGNGGDGAAILSEYAFPMGDDLLGMANYGAVNRAAGDIDEENHAITFTLSNYDEDRDGDVVVPMGGRLKNYAKNPVVFLGHQSWEIPIGTSRRPDGTLAVGLEENRVWATCFFDTADEDAVFIEGKVRRGMLNAASVAFVPIKAYKRDYEEKAHTHNHPSTPPGWYFQEWDLTEWSIVGVPANAGAIRNSLDREKSFISPRLQKALRPYAAVAKGCFNGWCPCPPCEETKMAAKTKTKAKPSTVKKCGKCPKGKPCPKCDKKTKAANQADIEHSAVNTPDKKKKGDRTAEERTSADRTAADKTSQDRTAGERTKQEQEEMALPHDEEQTGEDVDQETKGGSTVEDCVGAKIPRLIHEGYDEKQAAAIAYSMCGEKEVDDIGGHEHWAKKFGITRAMGEGSGTEGGYTTNPADEDEIHAGEDEEEPFEEKSMKSKKTPAKATKKPVRKQSEEEEEVEEEEAPPEEEKAEDNETEAETVVGPEPPHSAHVLANLHSHMGSAHNYLDGEIARMEPEAKDFFEKHKEELSGHMDSYREHFEKRHPEHNLDDMVKGIEGGDAEATEEEGESPPDEEVPEEEGEVAKAEDEAPPEEEEEVEEAPEEEPAEEEEGGESEYPVEEDTEEVEEKGESETPAEDESTDEILERYQSPAGGAKKSVKKVAKTCHKGHFETLRDAGDHMHHLAMAKDLPRHHIAGLKHHSTEIGEICRELLSSKRSEEPPPEKSKKVSPVVEDRFNRLEKNIYRLLGEKVN